ncbi:MAG TPA: hypothetical protein VFQ61_13685 [Polyangiaceae bacterium]|nr:hypothetical protein [Polyangiaceae bacterium]
MLHPCVRLDGLLGELPPWDAYYADQEREFTIFFPAYAESGHYVTVSQPDKFFEDCSSFYSHRHRPTVMDRTDGDARSGGRLALSHVAAACRRYARTEIVTLNLRSQNLRVAGPADPGKGDAHPPGRGFATRLRAALCSGGIDATEPENWRDSGWLIQCTLDFLSVDVVVAWVGVSSDGEWFVQIYPAKRPSPDATRACHAAAQCIHEALSAFGGFRDFRWETDGDPR